MDGDTPEYLRDLADKLTEACREREALIRALAKYGGHLNWCPRSKVPARWESPRPCTCGFSRALSGEPDDDKETT